MRIALVSPKWNQMVNSYPPLGLGYLAAALEADGHQVAIFDLGLEPNTPLEDDVARVAAFAPDLVGMTAMTNNYHSADAFMDMVRSQIGCPIVLGGPHATVFPQRLASDPKIDYLVYGEGEQTLQELVRALAAEDLQPSVTTLRGISGLCYARDGELICNPPRPLIEDLDSLPLPARHLFELDRYPLYAPNGERMVTLLSSRGCPYNCSYCFKGIVGRTYRQRSPESVLEEIRLLMREYGYRNFYFIDDLFTLDRRRLRAITTQIIEEGLDIRWQCLARVDRVTPELLDLMYRSGCRELHYGIESGNPEILASLGKGITLDQVRQAVKWTADVGILAKGYFMLGLPKDTDETMEQTIRFATELELDQAMFSLTTPFPGTRLWDELVARHPEEALDEAQAMHAFSRAYYYVNYDHMIQPFYNLSEVSDERLSELAFEAQVRFQEAKRKRKYLRALGLVLGSWLYDLSNVRALRRIGHGLLRGGLIRGLRARGRLGGLGELGEYNLREEFSQKWN
ncbi:MAG: radical SAM protein [Anaerolineae bacterium]|nr:radical SAM protein [Anaerolineae bacterium]